MSELSDEELKAERKRAAQVSVALGGLALVIGSLVCLAYLVIKKPWKIAADSSAQPNITRR